MIGTKPLRVALIGCGRIAKRHADILASKNIPGAELIAVLDKRQHRVDEFSYKYSVPGFTRIKDMMEELNPDLISVLTPSGLHASNVIELAPYKKHLIVEKPMALNLTDADAMIEVCNQYNCRLFVVKQNRFNLPVQRLRSEIEKGRFGKLVLGTVRVRWCRTQEYYDKDSWRGTIKFDGGVLSNQASHHIDLLSWMLGDVKSVMAMSNTALVNIEAEDIAIVLLKFTNGALGIIEATTATRPKDLEGSISILGENGSVVIEGFAVNKIKSWQFNEMNEDDYNVINNYSVNPIDVYGFGHTEFYKHVVDCIFNDKKQLIDGMEGRKSIKLITAIRKSIETKQEVSLERM